MSRTVHWAQEDGETLVEELVRKDRWLPGARARVPEGFVDLTAGLRCGIYALVLAQKIVFLGSAERPLEAIAAHRERRERPSWLPFRAIEFDQVWIKPSHPDRVDAELEALVREHKPIYNLRKVLRPAFQHPIRNCGGQDM